jgi:hypothetical protein
VGRDPFGSGSIQRGRLRAPAGTVWSRVALRAGYRAFVCTASDQLHVWRLGGHNGLRPESLAIARATRSSKSVSSARLTPSLLMTRPTRGSASEYLTNVHDILLRFDPRCGLSPNCGSSSCEPIHTGTKCFPLVCASCPLRGRDRVWRRAERAMCATAKGISRCSAEPIIHNLSRDFYNVRTTWDDRLMSDRLTFFISKIQ